MKKNTFLDRILPVICALLIAGMAVYLTGCPTDPGDGGKPGGEVPGTGPGGPGGLNVPSSLKFDLTGATAILVSDGMQGARAASDAKNILFKALANDSIQPLFDFSAIPNSSPPPVKFIARSPVAGKKDLYICFERNWDYWGEGYSDEDGNWVQGERVNIGSFIHVKDDGTIISIVWNEENSNNYIYDNQKNDPISFDSSGNLFFTATNDTWGYNTSTSSSVIYKYDPSTTESTALTLRANGMFYENVQLSTDGVYIIAKGRRWDSSSSNNVDFLRLIPTENPNAAVYIFYRSGYGSTISSFALNPRTKDVYLSGYGMDPTGTGSYNGSGIYKIEVRGINNITWKPIFTNDNYYYNPQFVTNSSEYVNGYYETDGEGNQVWVPGHYNYTYKWTSEFCDAEGEPDYDKMMAALKDYFLSDNIEFRHPRYNETGPTYKLKDKAALEKLYTDDELSLIGNDNQGTYHYPSEFCYKIGTSTVATRVENYDVNNMKTLIIGSNNSVWGIPESYGGKQVLTQLLNKDGGRDLYTPQSLNRAIISVKPTESYVYFCGDVSTTGGQTGAQNIYRFSYDNPETVENLFDNVYDRNTGNMEVLSYTISGNYLYFSTSQGTKILTGKINLTSQIYTEIEIGFKVTAMINY